MKENERERKREGRTEEVIEPTKGEGGRIGGREGKRK